MPVRDVAGALARILDRRERESADLVTARVQGRHPDGTVRYLPLRGECELRGQLGADQTGQLVQISASPAFSRRQGAIGAAFGSGRFGRDTLWVESISPSLYSPGASYTVTVAGRGFTEDVLIEFLLPLTATINPYITIDSQTLVDANTITLEISVDSLAPLFTAASISYGRVTS